jgi:hypothetical protein
MAYQEWILPLIERDLTYQVTYTILYIGKANFWHLDIQRDVKCQHAYSCGRYTAYSSILDIV